MCILCSHCFSKLLNNTICLKVYTQVLYDQVVKFALTDRIDSQHLGINPALDINVRKFISSFAGGAFLRVPEFPPTAQNWQPDTSLRILTGYLNV